MEKSALIAMSGGVDSSVAAYLMLRSGYACQGVTMRLYRNEDIGLSRYRTCCSQQDIDDAAEVCFKLDIPFEVLDYTADFRREVMDKFVRVYAGGGTPNPCIDCNRCLKFDKLVKTAKERGIDYVVTGHYARIELDESSGRYLLKRALDETKDQSYVLYMLTQHQLSHIQFPLGDKHKTETRALAEQLGFINARKRDSQDICFVPGGDYGAFLERYTGKTESPGDFLDAEGKVLGKHRGAMKYTLGQRRGLDLPMGERVYVCGKNMEKNTVTVGPESALFTRTVWAGDMNWIALETLAEPIRVKAKTRYRQVEQWATVCPEADGKIRLEFDEPQRAVTPGQALVIYDGDVVVGGGTILAKPEN